MIIIGEKLNSTISSVRTALENYDVPFIQDLAKKQAQAGASYLDLNAGMFHADEPQRLEWLVSTVQDAVNTPLVMDSPNPMALQSALKANKNGKPIINSLTDEADRFGAILPLVLEYNTGIVALCMDDSGMPETADERLAIAGRLVGKLTKAGIAPEDIYLDPMVRPVGTGSHYGTVAIDTIRKIKENFPETHIACGLSNISFGLPCRRPINQAFLIAAMTAGMDGAIMDPLDERLMTSLYATEALLGLDDYCMNYLTKYREGGLSQ